jgi:SAM-dependent methyltransferase
VTRRKGDAEVDAVCRVVVNPFDDPEVASQYEDWYSRRGRRADELEKKLLGKLLVDFPRSRTALEIGCGTGHFTRWLASRSLEVTGLDISAAMLAEARRLNGMNSVLGDALELPFPDRAFDLAALITTLEFVTDAERALNEAVRVARHGLLLGVLNRWSLLALRHRRSGKPPWNSARFFGPWELARLVRTVAGRRLCGIRWRTTIFPVPWLADLPLPWGGFIGLAARLRDNKSKGCIDG